MRGENQSVRGRKGLQLFPLRSVARGEFPEYILFLLVCRNRGLRLQTARRAFGAATRPSSRGFFFLFFLLLSCFVILALDGRVGHFSPLISLSLLPTTATTTHNTRAPHWTTTTHSAHQPPTTNHQQGHPTSPSPALRYDRTAPSFPLVRVPVHSPGSTQTLLRPAQTPSSSPWTRWQASCPSRLGHQAPPDCGRWPAPPPSWAWASTTS